MADEQGRVLNLHHSKGVVPDGAIRIDRKSHWGNPYPMQLSSPEERARVIEAHHQYLWAQIKKGSITLEELAALDGKDLACWCAPRPCHGDTLHKAAKWAVAELAKRQQGAK